MPLPQRIAKPIKSNYYEPENFTTANSYGSVEHGRRSVSDTLAFRNSSLYFRSSSTDLSNYSKRRKRYMVGLGEDLTGILESQQIRLNYETNSFKLRQENERNRALKDDGGESGDTISDETTSLRSFRKLEERRTSIQRIDLLLFFILGVAVSAPFTAILSCLSYFSKTLYESPKVFLYLNIAVYCPTIIVSTMQGLCDLHYNAKYGHLLAYNFRITVTFIVSAIVLIVAPTLHGISVDGGKHIVPLILVTLSFGVLHQISYGSFYQIASFIPSNGKCLALFSMGYQGAGFVIFVAQLASHYTYDPSEYSLRMFFYFVAGIEIVGLIAYVILNTREDTFLKSMKNQDSIDEIVEESKDNKQIDISNVINSNTENYDNSYDGNDKNNVSVNRSMDAPLLSSNNNEIEVAQAPLSVILDIIWPEVVALFCTIFGSIFLLTFYAYIESDGTCGGALPTILFFTKVGFDTLSRPLTMYFHPFRNAPKNLMACSIFILLFLPLFFLYLNGDIPKNDLCLIGAIAIFSITSGFFNTNADQLASEAVEADEQVRVSSIMSFIFTIGLNVALLVATVVQELFYEVAR